MKSVLVSIISVTFILDACKVSFLNYLQVFLNVEKRVPDVKHMLTIVQERAPAPPTGLYISVAPSSFKLR